MVEIDRLFTARPQWSRQCTACSGRGQVTDSYWLAPANTHDLLGVPGRLAQAPDGAILAVVVGSASIFEAVLEASDIARRGQLAVAFEFIDVLVVVRPGDDPHVVARAWYLARYGETPEQTAQRR